LAFSQGAVIWVFIAEDFPNAVRAKGQAQGSFTHWFMAAAIIWTLPIIAAKSGAWPFGFFAAYDGTSAPLRVEDHAGDKGGDLGRHRVPARVTRCAREARMDSLALHGAFERVGMASTTGRGATAILEALRDRKSAPWLVAIAGIPGAGKSTVAADIASRVRGAVVIPMDGYHLPRAALSADGLARRGAPDTFDPDSLRADLAYLQKTGRGVFPAFDHAAMDPKPGAVIVPTGSPLVIVEGLYLLLAAWRMADLFDFAAFLDCKIEVALTRVAARHLECGLASTESEARHRADTNDRRNALTILDDGCRDRADLSVPAGD
jgi:pantothenate kinase